MKVDAIVEAGLGVALLAGGFGAADFPHPVGRTVVVAVGVLLLFLGAALWFVPIGLIGLAAGNGATAVLATVWLALAAGFSASGGALVASTAAALACLAAAQVTAARTPASGGGISAGSSAPISNGG